MERRRLINPLVYWAREREALRKRKAEGGPPPWTDDPILSHFRFCNLRRRDDRVTQWLIKKVLDYPHIGCTEWSFIQFVSLCRWINWPPTIASIMEAGLWPKRELDLSTIGGFLDGQRLLGKKTWTGAYMIRAPRKSQFGSIGKGKFVAMRIVGESLVDKQLAIIAAVRSHRLETVWAAFCSAYGWGSFMSGQVVADLALTSLLPNAEDLYTWAPTGPGSIRGYNRLLGNPLRQRPESQEAWCARLQRWRVELIEALGDEYVDLTLGDVQNALCETDKYLRVKLGEGRPRSVYKPETAY